MKMLSNKAGVPWLRCPYCGKRLFRLFDNTSCSNLPLWCRMCKRELVLTIDRKTDLYKCLATNNTL